MRGINVATFETMEPAQTLTQRLENAGVHAQVHDETRLQQYGFMTKPAATKRVEVDKDDFFKAEQLLAQWDKMDGILNSAVRCPECGSPRVEYPQYTRKFVMPMLIEFFVSIGLFPKEYYCEHCQFTWPKEIKSEPERDALGWPVEKKKDGKGPIL